MAQIRIQVTVIYSTDITNRYLTVELYPISTDWTTWEHKIILNKGATGLVYDQVRNVSEGTYPVWVGITAFVGNWTVKVTVLNASGQKLLETQTTIGSEFVKNLGNITVSGGGGTIVDGVGFDPSQIIGQMMNMMMPMIVQIMGMSMMINMMVGMMQSLTQAF
jgi:hypothetical protein